MLEPDAAPAKPNLSPEAKALLAWYDRAHRRLPWRAPPGRLADAYRVWLSEIMLQQTTVQAVKPYFEKFLALWPDVRALAAADRQAVLSAWAGLGYYSRARNLHACAGRVVEDHGGLFPSDEAALRKLPGVGPYTAAAIAAIAYGRRAVVVDGNVERVVSRLRAIVEPLPAAKPMIRAAADRITPATRPGDFAQAMMDLGATICTPRKPACALCPLAAMCRAHAEGIAADLPRKAAKPDKPVRRGAAFVARDGNGRLLVRTRPDKGLLGGMTEVPGSDWEVEGPLPERPHDAPLPADWRPAGTVGHVFTHFRLELAVFAAAVPAGTAAPPGMVWLDGAGIAGAALPNVMRKVLARAEPTPPPSSGGHRRAGYRSG